MTWGRSSAIFTGYCCAVAAIAPDATSLIPWQPPSTETSTTPFSFPAALSALYAPAAVGSLIVYTTLMSGFFWRHVSIPVCPFV